MQRMFIVCGGGSTKGVVDGAQCERCAVHDTDDFDDNNTQCSLHSSKQHSYVGQSPLHLRVSNVGVEAVTQMQSSCDGSIIELVVVAQEWLHTARGSAINIMSTYGKIKPGRPQLRRCTAARWLEMDVSLCERQLQSKPTLGCRTACPR